MVPYALCILQQYYVEFHWNASATAYRILSIVLCEVSRLYVKKCPRKIPENIKCVWKNYSGENGIQRKVILCWDIPGNIQKISDRNTFYNYPKWTFYQVICNNNHLTSGQICRRTNIARKCKCAASHGLFHRNKHFGMIEHATKKRCFILFHDKNVYAGQVE